MPILADPLAQVPSDSAAWRDGDWYAVSDMVVWGRGKAADAVINASRILDTFAHMVHRHGSADAIARAWRQEGVTHVLIFRSGLQFVLNESPGKVDTAVLSELETRYLRKLSDVAGAYQVYALQAATGEKPP